MNASRPLVSVGMPVFNEAAHVDSAIRSILCQTYENLEIIISDNSSTDETYEICRRLRDTDTRIRIHRFNTNLGISRNSSYVLESATGRYFMWASGHDLWAENYISECVSILERNPTSVIAFGSSQWIDPQGRPLSIESGWTDTRGLNAAARFMTVFWGNMHPILGIIRKEALDQCQPIETMVGADLVVLSKLVLKGHFLHATNTDWMRREFRNESNYSERLQRYRSNDYALTQGWFTRLFPLVRLPFRLSQAILAAQTLSLSEKWTMVLALWASLPVRYVSGRRRYLQRDV